MDRLQQAFTDDQPTLEEEVDFAEQIVGTAHVVTGERPLTVQQKKAVALLAQALPTGVVAQQVGCTAKTIREWRKLPQVQRALEYYGDLTAERMVVTRELLTVQLYEERARASNAMEGISALREIGKLNGLYAPEKTEHVTEIKNVKQLEALDNQRLIELTGNDVSLIAEPIEYDDADDADG